ncbi:galactose-specific lectin nattectin-like [Sander lucioperca]|uniref:galactose-specific lectin nattectin-like n=1 Tax=Sander lucioperca TaxID=283035 RepID=UPI00125E3D4D|nr:galactose-specific lectin nattectin-like [Sander lucioperca]
MTKADCESDQCCEECKTCPPGWTQFKDHCYVNRHASKDWADAEVACIGLGGNLASVPDKDTYDFVKNIINTATDKNDETWVKGQDTTKVKGVWLSTDGTKFQFSLWGAGQPDNTKNNEHCMELNYLGSPIDVACNQKRPFVCGKRLAVHPH